MISIKKIGKATCLKNMDKNLAFIEAKKEIELTLKFIKKISKNIGPTEMSGTHNQLNVLKINF